MSVNVENGRTADVEFPFYTGPVGVRERDGHSELAYFGVAPELKFPIYGKVDGKRVSVTAIQSRDLDQTTASVIKPKAIRVVTLFVEPR